MKRFANMRPVGAGGTITRMAADSGKPQSDHGQPLLTVAAAARRVGVAPPTLRTWDRRYGLGPSAHVPGAHRRYTPDDVRRLDVMHRLVLDGVSAGDAARMALAADVGKPSAAQVLPAFPSRLPAAEPAGHTGAEASVVSMAGHRAMRSHERTAALTRAATAFDATTITVLLDDEIARRGTVPTWQDVITPLLVAVGKRWETTGRGVEVEHLVAGAVASTLRQHTRRVQRPATTPRYVLLACAEEEQHSLPLRALEAALAERGVSSRVLGARVPAAALAAAVRRSGPTAVFLWSQTALTGDPAAVEAVPAVRPAPLVVIGGPGWPPGVPEGPRLRRVGELAEAVETLVAATR